MPELEALLNQHLGPVPAPRELWERVHRPREPRGRGARRVAWAAASAVLVLASLLSVHAQLESPRMRQPVQAWMKSSTGLDLRGACSLCHME